MKRFHVHIAVDNLGANVAFYSKLFGQDPAKQRPDYAKWMLDDPRVNFAISARGHGSGVNHFGMQAETDAELADLKVRADEASQGETLDAGEATCCYAKSEKHWTVDPQGLAWEHFLTMSDSVTFGEDRASQDGSCCIPLRAPDDPNAAKSESCCVPVDAKEGQAACCA